jgi:hypothetical protein
MVEDRIKCHPPRKTARPTRKPVPGVAAGPSKTQPVTTFLRVDSITPTSSKSAAAVGAPGAGSVARNTARPITTP